jgi:hypothetical protein
MLTVKELQVEGCRRLTINLGLAHLAAGCGHRRSPTAALLLSPAR